jgi:hypothetical protein
MVVRSQRFHAGSSHDVYRKRDKFGEFSYHAGNLSALLRQPENGLLEYVVATCYWKIRFRLRHALSNPYFQFLNDTESSSNFPQFRDFMSERPQPSKHKHLQNDTRFFFDILPRLVPMLEKKVPQLEKAMTKATSRDAPIAAYNKDTYIEYHQLLCELLRRFSKSLDKLEGFVDATSKPKDATSKPKDATSKPKDAHDKPKDFIDASDFDTSLNEAIWTGDALQAMAGGCVIEVHMKIITMVLDKSPRTVLDTNQETEWDEEFHQMGSKPPWQAYCEWLKLMVVHFDAVRILIAHMYRMKYPKVVIKVIITPNPDNKLLS